MPRNLRIQTLINQLSSLQDSRLSEILTALNDNTMDTNQAIDAIKTEVADIDLSGFVTLTAFNTLVTDFNNFVATFTNHKDRHKSGGADAFLATDLLEALIKRVRTATADLIFGTINNGEFLKRSGNSVVGASISSGGRWEPITNGDPLAPEILFDGATGDVLMNFIP